jgi:mono/diheme cytochrome c family protein
MKMIFISSIFALALYGCEDPHNSMGEQPRYATYQSSDFFADGSSERPPVPGTIPRNAVTIPSDKMPFALTADVIEHGQKQYDIYCAVCHGRLGNGEGMIVERGLVRPPSFHIDRLKNSPDSHFYNVITNGYGAMFSYNDRVSPQQRWEIVAYIRALQAAPDVAQASSDVRKKLIARGDRDTSTGIVK